MAGSILLKIHNFSTSVENEDLKGGREYSIKIGAGSLSEIAPE
jgi:hypothetical protein